jgi:predicted transcriptional regulator
MTHSGEPSPAEREDPPDALVKSLDRAGRAANKALVRWLLDAEVPLFAACVLVTLEPPDSPMSVGEVAEAIGSSNDEAARALHELRSLGYAREEKRRYEPTEEGLRVHASLASARREAIATFLSDLSEDERRELAEASSSKD